MILHYEMKLEWVETVELGWNRVIGAEENVILSTYDMVKKEKLDNSDAKPYGDGDSANKIVKKLLNDINLFTKR